MMIEERIVQFEFEVAELIDQIHILNLRYEYTNKIVQRQAQQIYKLECVKEDKQNESNSKNNVNYG